MIRDPLPTSDLKPLQRLNFAYPFDRKVSEGRVSVNPDRVAACRYCRARRGTCPRERVEYGIADPRVHADQTKW